MPKRDEEALMIERVERETNERKAEEGGDGSTSALNPDAVKFVPQFKMQ